ncbi:hypothetical protein RhiirA4_425250 [Rhizophagus irregularis]|uniref:Uncharacterized protein n=1 Tax=Rhizophagus irregularis TaxID=588596 RepID=A0A2I1H0M1_9GLOM|nr:hypothetical protein RhiirA4_425250 [Rhizophagus irregularis]
MEPSETNSISRDQSETFNTKDCQYANQKASSICCESDIYYPEGKDSQIHVWNISQLWISRKRGDSQQKNGKYENIGVDSGSCSNTRRKIEMRLSFGELCRVGTLGIAKRTNEEIQCNYVYAMHEHKNGGDGPVSNISESSEQNESEGLGLNRVIWTAEYDGIKYKALPDYDLEMAENYDLKMAEQARKTRTNGVKNKHLTNKKNKKK